MICGPKPLLQDTQTKVKLQDWCLCTHVVTVSVTVHRDSIYNYGFVFLFVVLGSVLETCY